MEQGKQILQVQVNKFGPEQNMESKVLTAKLMATIGEEYIQKEVEKKGLMAHRDKRLKEKGQEELSKKRSLDTEQDKEKEEHKGKAGKTDKEKKKDEGKMDTPTSSSCSHINTAEDPEIIEF